MSWVVYFKEMATKEATKALSEKAFADTLSATQYCSSPTELVHRVF